MKEQDYRQLQEQFLQLLSLAENMQQRIAFLEKGNQILVKSQKQFAEWIEDNLAENSHFRENLIFEIMDDRCIQKTEEFWYPQIASRKETLRRILEEKASISRFGDGEFAAICGRIRHKFQTVYDKNLSERLREVLDSEEPGLLIALADNYGSLDCYTEQSRREIRYYMTRQVRREHLNLLKKERLYYDAYITRPYVMYADNETDAPAVRFQELKQIWGGRKCVFVEGKMTGLGVGNDLFDNAASIQRILAPAENAFFQYSGIKETCLRQPQNSLFLLALGPSAAVLAYDLHKAGYQAVDIGHIDLEYEWFLQGKGCRTQVKGKYNNEAADAVMPEPIDNKEYSSQVIADFS